MEEGEVRVKSLKFKVCEFGAGGDGNQKFLKRKN
jgi:hypothetical protein